MFAAALRRASRANALPETAVMISFVMIMLFGIMQIGLMTYYQTSADAAVFFTAHEYSIYANPTNINSALTSTFPNVVAANVTVNPSQPPNVNDTLFQGIYGCNDGYPTTCSTTRYSGYEVVRPQSFQALMQTGTGDVPLFHGIFGFNNLPLSAGAVEPLYLITNNIWDNYGAGANGDLSTGYLNEPDASPFLNGNSDNNMNVPPYYSYAGVNQSFCSDPWSGPDFPGDTCENPVPWWLGLGEYLSNSNYGSTAGLGSGDIFEAMACHQRVYADLILAFPHIASPSSTYAGSATYNFAQTFQGATRADPTPTPPANGPWTLSPAYYDEMAMYEQGVTSLGGGQNSSFAIAQRYFDNTDGCQSLRTGACVVTPDSNNAAQGPYQWSSTPTVSGSNGASFALVYQWDQPVDYGSLTEGFFNPLVGCASGEPGQ
jgi:hypothetical protein